MLGIEGVTREDGKYMFAGKPVTLILLIRNDSDGTRVPIGDYVANQLESIGFAVDRQYKKSSEASPIWVDGNPADAADGTSTLVPGLPPSSPAMRATTSSSLIPHTLPMASPPCGRHSSMSPRTMLIGQIPWLTTNLIPLKSAMPLLAEMLEM